LMFYGPSGAGKKTRILALLKEMFGKGIEKASVTHRSFKVKSRTIDISAIISNYHIELNPSEAGFNDRHVIQEVITEIAESYNINTASGKQFKVVVLSEVDRLSRDAQHALRRTMEKYSAACRLILCGESSCRVIAPLKSRCLLIRVAAPSTSEMIQVLQHVATKENFTLPAEFAKRIAMEANGNLRKAILTLEACKADKYPFSDEQKIKTTDWERFIEDVARGICEDQSAKSLQLTREKLYELLTNCIPADVVLKTLTRQLVRRLDDQLKHQIIRWAAFYEHRLQCGSKAIFHLEAFVAKFMSLYKRWVLETFVQ